MLGVPKHTSHNLRLHRTQWNRIERPMQTMHLLKAGFVMAKPRQSHKGLSCRGKYKGKPWHKAPIEISSPAENILHTFERAAFGVVGVGDFMS